MDYLSGYILCGILFVLGAAGYWGVTRSFRDPSAIYESVETPTGTPSDALEGQAK